MGRRAHRTLHRGVDRFAAASLPSRANLVRLRRSGLDGDSNDLWTADAEEVRSLASLRTRRRVLCGRHGPFFNSCNLLIAAYNLIENPGTLEPVMLFYTSVGIWFGNILIFTLIYWLVDDGGPDARLNREAHYPDFDFPAMEDGAPVRPGWRPGDRRLSLSCLHDQHGL